MNDIRFAEIRDGFQKTEQKFNLIFRMFEELMKIVPVQGAVNAQLCAEVEELRAEIAKLKGQN